MKFTGATNKTAAAILALCLTMPGTGWCAITEIYLRAGVVTNIMPDGRSVVMWGFAQDSSAIADDGVVSVPGPAIRLGTGNQDLVIHLKNRLPDPVSIVIPGQLITAAIPSRNPDGRMRSFSHEAPPGGTADFSWSNLKSGTSLYHSGTHADLQVEMGLLGAIIVRPTVSTQAYNHADTTFDTEFLFLLTEMDPKFHALVEQGRMSEVDTTTFFPVYWFINGRCGPDTLADAIYTWTGAKLGWDIYGHTSTNELTYGEPFGGGPFLGRPGFEYPGTLNLNPDGAFMYMWHSHSEKEIVNDDIFPGGMMTMLMIMAPTMPMP